MKHFLVEVGVKSIKVYEQKKPLSTVHICANVDGERHVYQIKKARFTKQNLSGWFQRGSNHAYYHARNSGSYVTFTPVTRNKRSKKKQVSPKQLEMF